MYKRRKHTQSICSEALKAEIKRQNITVKAMAYELNVNVQVLYRWMRGDKIPKLDEAYAVANYLGITLDELCRR